MARIKVDFNDVPNEIVPIAPGIYGFEVEGVPTIEKTKDGTGTKLVVKCRITEDGPEKGRVITDQISTKMETKMKRLAMTCGLAPGAEGFDTEDLVGRGGRFRIAPNTFTDSSSGETVHNSKVADYVIA